MTPLLSARPARRVAWVFAFLLWAGAMAFGFHQAMSWEFSPGASAKPPNKAQATRPTMVVALHSQCPCSVATVDNLLTLTREERARLDIKFVFTGPHPESSALMAKANAAGIPSTVVPEDEMFERYGAKTSGQVLLYDATGKLAFSGGVTDARGVPGDSAGMTAIKDFLLGRRPAAETPVYGCSLQTPK